MGCDIHLFTERKRSINNVQKWVSCDRFKKNPYLGEPGERELEVVSVYSNRNYGLFATLADVRNNGNTPFICEPKGVPGDCSEFYKETVKDWGSDGHSHSFFTLKELKDFRKNQPFELHSGFVSPEDAKKIEENEYYVPNVSCQWTSDTSWLKAEWKEESSLDYLIKKIEERKKEEWHIYGEEEHPEYDDQIRICFFFDN